MTTSNKNNLSMWQGTTFTHTIGVKYANGIPVDVTGYSAEMQIRSSYDSNTIVEQLSTSNDEITTTGANGQFVLQLSPERTANIYVDLTNGKPPKNTYVYDMNITDANNNVSKIMYGDLIVYGEVTR